MGEHVRARPPTLAIAGAIGAAGIALLALVGVSSRYPLPIIIGARPVPLFAGLMLAAALGTAAIASDPPSRHPSLAMPLAQRYLVLVWWIGVSVALASLSYAAWKAWGVVAMFASLVALVKVLQVAGFITQGRSVRVWHPFAAIMASFLAVAAIFAFLARPNLPPPIQAAMVAYRDRRAGQSSASRPAPEVSATGLTLRTSGDVDLGGLPATLFSYDDREGSRVDIYEADIGFPAPQGSVGVEDPAGWFWSRTGCLCGPDPEGATSSWSVGRPMSSIG